MEKDGSREAIAAPNEVSNTEVYYPMDFNCLFTHVAVCCELMFVPGLEWPIICRVGR